MKAKRFERRIGKAQGADSITSPASMTATSPPESALSIFCDPFMKKQIDRMRLKTRIDLVKQGLKDLSGRYSPLDYRPEFGFEESWENTSKLPQVKEDQYAQNQTSLLYGVQWIILVAFGLSLWFLSIYRVFEVGAPSMGAIIAIFCLVLFQIIYKQWFLCHHFEGEKEQSSNTFKRVIKKQWSLLLFLAYLGLLMAEIDLDWLSNLALLPLDFVFMAQVYAIIKKKYAKLRIKLMSSPWRNELQIVQLVGGCLSLVHLFSVVLMLASHSDTNLNWTKSIYHFDQSWLDRYIYSLYFTCSTMFTVGYGDLTPKNKWEIITILVVQVVGIINNGYVINEVGRFVSKINESQYRLYNNISDTEKLASNYKMPEELTGKMRSYFISNDIASNKFNVEQEDELLKKVNEDIAQEVISHNRFQLVKTSVFFLCHWTKQFQKHIALKLERNIYNPGDVLLQTYGNERIYVLERGKVNIEPTFSTRGKYSSFVREKSLKILQIDSKRGVQFNVFGYSALISGLKVNLKALAKDYSICYSISRQNLMAVLGQNSQDFQYFHQIRSKIEESYCKQAWQAPKINEPREHYVPLLYLIIKKQKGRSTTRQNRKQYLRSPRAPFKVIQNEILNTEKELECNAMAIQRIKGNRFSIEDALRVSFDNVSNEMEEARAGEKPKGTSEDTLLRCEVEDFKHHEEQQRLKLYLLSVSFESARQYSRFRSKFNSELRIEKYNQLHCKAKGSQSNSLRGMLASAAFSMMQKRAKLRLMKSRVLL